MSESHSDFKISNTVASFVEFHSIALQYAIYRYSLAQHLGIPAQRVNEIIRGKRGVSPETAWLLSGALGTTPEFWLNLQATHDLSVNRPARHVERFEGIAA